LLATGKAIPISAVKVGDKVQATNSRTGKTQAETVTAIIIHHDTDLYDLRIKAGNRTAVIHTTSNHPFWVPAANGHGGRWATAGTLKHGARLRTPSGNGTATVLGGWTPANAAGWMWDLTVPGNNDHDFYVDVVHTAVLVHNCGDVPDPEPQFKPSGVRNRDSAVYISVRDEDGTVSTVGSIRGGPHAEDVAQDLVPGGQMSRPFGWRTPFGADEPEWTPIDVCSACQAKYS
jgi:hypothetical protein